VSGQFHANALIQRQKQMLSNAEDEKPDKHNGKTRRIKSDKKYPYGAKDVGQSGLPSGTHKK
jgi:hypothetical protein